MFKKLKKLKQKIILQYKKTFEGGFRNLSGDYFVKPIPIYIPQSSLAKKSKYWSKRACGIVGLQMVLATLKGKKFKSVSKTMELIDQGLALGGYNTQKDVGWYHFALTKLAHKYGLEAQPKKYVLLDEIPHFLLRNFYVLASIDSNMGGHLILIYGARLKDGKVKGFFLHDPASFFRSQKSVFVLKNKIERVFKHNVILFR